MCTCSLHTARYAGQRAFMGLRLQPSSGLRVRCLYPGVVEDACHSSQGPAHALIWSVQVGPVSGVLRGRGMDEWTPKQVADTVLIDRRARRCAHASLHSCCASGLGLPGLVPAACSGILEGRAAPCFLAAALCFTQPTVFSSSSSFAGVCRAQ